MKKLLGIVVLSLLFCNNVLAKTYGGILDSFTKDHKYCSEIAKSITKNKIKQGHWYNECRLQLDVFGTFNWKMQFGVHDEKNW